MLSNKPGNSQNDDYNSIKAVTIGGMPTKDLGNNQM